MGMPHGKILVHTISNIYNPTTEAPSAGPNGELGRLALESDLNTLEVQVDGNTTALETLSTTTQTGATSASVFVVDSVAVSAGYNGATWTVVVESQDETNMRTSSVISAWKDDGSSIRYAEMSSIDIGDTDPVVLSVALSGSNIQIQATITGSDIWNIKSVRLSI